MQKNKDDVVFVIYGIFVIFLVYDRFDSIRRLHSRRIKHTFL